MGTVHLWRNTATHRMLQHTTKQKKLQHTEYCNTTQKHLQNTATSSWGRCISGTTLLHTEYCNTLQKHSQKCCNTLIKHCNTLNTATHYRNTLKNAATHWQNIATHWILQHTTETLSKILQHTDKTLLHTEYCNTLQKHSQKCCHTLNAGWRRLIDCLIISCHFPQKSPVISGSFAKKMTRNLKHPVGLRHPVL